MRFSFTPSAAAKRFLGAVSPTISSFCSATVDAAESSFTIDRHKVYLVGYSMGGFAVYRVAPLHAERWSGIMSISGAILNSQMQTYVTRCRNIKLYVASGPGGTGGPVHPS